jgi:hypothetical protein
MNIIFKVDIPQKIQISTMEDHIEFVSVPVNKLKNYNILPTNLKNGLLKWLKDKRPFFREI